MGPGCSTEPLAPAAKEATRPQRREGEGKRRARRARSALPSLGGRVGNYGHHHGRGTATLCDGEDISTDEQAKVQQGEPMTDSGPTLPRPALKHKTLDSWYSAVTPRSSKPSWASRPVVRPRACWAAGARRADKCRCGALGRARVSAADGPVWHVPGGPHGRMGTAAAALTAVPFVGSAAVCCR
jgi:hypothetical protein